MAHNGRWQARKNQILAKTADTWSLSLSYAYPDVKNQLITNRIGHTSANLLNVMP
jgi:hypothetical protein